MDAVDVSDMYMSTDKIEAFGNKFAGMNVGQNAPDAAATAGLARQTSGGGSAPQDGQSGLMAERMNPGQLDGGSFGIEMAGGMKLPGLRVRSIRGVATRADCALEATTP
ncbi:hypothetical protein [Nocardioides sp. B-3]|uniref:hypothetical protein n=1 Tax=Nocardioides sp. B-3 TaxID=2895565 RepID=UPI002153A403|nr:hypothetical protein [Nocardioides sp. B-3]UUZ61466.1 hypothetical protein LP418_13385 [Nocardioides sp. B-3]